MSSYPEGVKVLGEVKGAHATVLTPEALKFLAVLHRAFEPARQTRLAARQLRQAQFDQGILPDFLPETKHIREDPSWQGAPPAPGLVDRRVEITGPVDRKMVINALNSGAYTYMADFEDSSAPTWLNCLDGQVNLRDAIARKVDFKQASTGKEYKLNDPKTLATLLVRPRGWHLNEDHVVIDGKPIAGGIFDFGLYFFHNAKRLIANGHGPYFYLPKMESHLEARIWNDIFNVSQDYIGIPRGTIRATVLIETITAAFEMEEIIYELRDHSAGLNCGRWDYIFSFIKRQRYNKNAAVLPDRSTVTMTVPFMRAYTSLVIHTCHKRGVAAIGGMAAQIPIKDDAKKNEAAMKKVTEDKLREAVDGHDGTWVAHPALVKIALDIFNKHMPSPNQYHVRRPEVSVSALDLLNTNMPGTITEAGVRSNVAALLGYCGAWVVGIGCSPLNYMMEDAATAEISRVQLWAWTYHGAQTDNGAKITTDYVDRIVDEEVKSLSAANKRLAPKYELVARYMKDQIRRKAPTEFLTVDLTPHLDDYASTEPAKL